MKREKASKTLIAQEAYSLIQGAMENKKVPQVRGDVHSEKVSSNTLQWAGRDESQE